MEERTLKEILDFLSHHPKEYLNAPVVECTIKVRIHGQVEEYKYPKVTMKELSIAEKAKRYDEALTKARNIVNSINVGLIGKDSFEAVFPELKESEDERIRKWLIKDMGRRLSCWTSTEVTKEQVLAWLEKQGEQKPDKVEPKFKVDDWVVTDMNNVVQIKAIENSKYVLENRMRFTIDYVDNCWNLWTIKDAKDGDVLTAEDCPTSFIAMYKEHGLNFFNSHCFISCDGEFHKGTTGHATSLIHPATKEQRDILFQKMKEAGYEWDAMKKELKKIENKNPMLSDFFKAEYERGKSDAIIEMQKLAWNEEDNKKLEQLIGWLYGHVGVLNGGQKKYAEWLSSLKDKVITQSNKEWSKDDEHWRQRAIDFMIHPYLIKAMPTLAEDIINWLKSLRPQSQWRPSDEQMDALLFVVQHYTPNVTDKLAWDSIKILELMYYEIKK